MTQLHNMTAREQEVTVNDARRAIRDAAASLGVAVAELDRAAQMDPKPNNLTYSQGADNLRGVLGSLSMVYGTL